MKTVKKLTKETAKVEATPVKDTKTAVKNEAPKAAAAPAAKATTVEKTTEKTTAENTAVKTETAKKAAPARKTGTARRTAAAKKSTEIKETVYLQCFGKEISAADLSSRVKEIWEKEYNKKTDEIETLEIYLKPEEDAAYYVINSSVTGSISL